MPERSKELYREFLKNVRGQDVDEDEIPTTGFLGMLGHSPDMLEARLEYYKYRFDNDLTGERGDVDERLKQLIYVVVSRDNRCEYCASEHGSTAIRNLDVPETTVDAVVDHDYTDLTQQERVALAYAEKLNADPNRVTPDDVRALSDVGFDDAQIVELSLIISSAGAANTFVSGLSISHDDADRKQPEMYTAGVE